MDQQWGGVDASRIGEIVDGWSGRPVLVVGDAMLDRYVFGSVSRISPEAPVPVLDVEEETCRLGGAANVANNVRALGTAPRLVAVRGDDWGGGRLVAELRAVGVDGGAIVVDPDRPTSLKTRIVARGHHLVRVDREDRAEIAGRTLERMRAAIEEALPGCGAVVVSDYGKGVVTADLLEGLLARAAAARIPVCVDPKDIHFFKYRGVAVVTPNQHEAAEVLGYKLRSDELVDRAGREILARLESDAVLITRGERGMSLFERSGARTDLPAEARRVYDVTGAGDTVVTVYAASLSAGASPREAAFLANRAAGQVVQEVGTAVPDVARLRAGDGAAR